MLKSPFRARDPSASRTSPAACAVVWVFAAVLASTAACAATPVAPAATIVRAVADPERPDEDRERDLRDKPAEVLAFFGVKPGMRVFDLNAAGGYYTELLARAVGPRGHVVAHNHPGAVKILGEPAINGRYQAGRLPNVETLMARHGELKLAPRSLDLVMMSMVYHDTYYVAPPGVDWGPVDRPALLHTFYEALRPGGLVGVIDNVAAPGSDPLTSVNKLHRIDPEVLRRDFLRAGFVFDGQSDLLRRPDDDYSLIVFDPAVAHRTDRVVMRFRRP